ncbi:hypothetical protein ACHAWU_008210 [Discostella pseudostelligera]|uniref:ATP-dependent RNA helicase n=1 Tax=Discostella pseudostelligera TaxID=259834 RepID=A0ABD3MAD8_9STRA
MAAAPINNDDDDDNDVGLLGLNLVFADPISTPDGGSSGNNKNPKKRKTKYDRRRERGRLAKLAKLDRQQQQQHAADAAVSAVAAVTTAKNNGGNKGLVDTKEGVAVISSSSSLAGIAAALSGSIVGRGSKSSFASSSSSSVAATAKQPPSALASAENDDTDTRVKHDANNNQSYDDGKGGNNIEDDQTLLSSFNDDNNTTDGVPSKTVSKQSASGRTKSVTNATSSSVLVDTMKNEPMTSSSSFSNEDFAISSSSRRHREPTSLTEEQRLKYLSEFHARPRDLDRSERAARVIKESCASDHLFAREDEDFNDNYDDDDTTHLKDETHDGKAANNTNCASEVSMTTTTTTCAFSKLGLHPKLASALTSPSGHFRLSQPTIIQSRCIAALLPKNAAKGKTNKPKSSSSSNLFIQSETGSGKTLAYLLPILQHLAVVPGDAQSIKRIDRQMGGTRCIILCPTRELATQTYTFANHLCNSSFPWIVPGCFSGGEKRKSEKARLRKGISILIGTPGRLLDHLSKTESLLMALKNKLEWLVLDEVDRLLDAGLGGQVEQIVQHLRSNQPGAGPKRDGVTWRSVLVSATVTVDIEGLAKTVLGGEGWLWARGHAVKSSAVGQGTMQLVECEDESSTNLHKDTDKGSININELNNATPRQLAQLFIVVSAKLRLAALIAFLSARAAKGERTVVFLSTCDSVDYHHALLTSMESILGSGKDVVDDEVESGGIFGKACPIFKLHGDIPHNKRMTTINDFNSNQQSAILLATDVAGRGLNFPSLDWIVQYDPPCETNDYCHRAGRSARAGKAGHALLFLLPSERQYIEVLRLRGLKDISALSLSSTLSTAAALCTGVTQEFETKAAGNKFSDGGGEAFTTVIQNRLEQCVIQNDLDYKASIETKFKGDPKKRRRQKKDAVGPLLEGARKAFASFVRAYPAKEKAVRHIFNARALHLGHIARSLALKETPKMVSKGNQIDTMKSSQSGGGDGENRKSRLKFGKNPVGTDENEDFVDTEHERNLSLLSDAIGMEHVGSSKSPSTKRAKLQSGDRRSSGNDVQKRMMEAAMAMQTQEFV